MYDKRGSVWRKWDLHVHTPASIIQHYGGDKDEVWERYISDLESLPEEYSVLGINDYLFLDGYERLIEEKEENNRLGNIDLLLPVVEFRIEKFAGIDFGAIKRINFHVIFSNSISLETIQSQFLNTLEQSYTLNDGEEWDRAITRESISDLGKSIKESVPEEEQQHYENDLIEGFNNLNVNEDQIFKALERDCFDGEYLTAIGKTEWNSLKWTDASIATKKTIINRSDIVFTAAESTEAFDNAFKKLTEQQVNNLLLDCSDAHHFSDSEDKDRVGNCFAWIKADPTFEGLKQILFEPESRVFISEKPPPPPPPKSINKVSLNIAKDLYVKKDESDEKEVFCLNGNIELSFSPNLNCLIGGRGTGKSTILNLMRLKIEDKGKSLYPKSEVVDQNGDHFSMSDIIDLEGTTSKEIEFLSQNEIEQFALNTLEFTKAVYDRLKQIGDRNNLEEKSDELTIFLSKVDKTIEHQKRKIKLVNQLQVKKNAHEDKNKEIKILEDEKYSELQDEINKYSKELAQLRSSRKRLDQMLYDIFEIIQKYEEESYSNENEVDYNEFDQIINEEVKALRDFYSDNHESANVKNDREEELEEKLAIAERELQEYLSELGYEQQNISNISSAQSEANELEQEIERNEKEISILTNKISSITFSNEKRVEFENLLKPRIKELNETLKRISEATEEVEEISLEYEFDAHRAFINLCKAFNRNELPSFDSGTALSNKDVIVLFDQLFKENDEFELRPDQEIMEVLESNRNNIKTNKVIFDFFNHNKEEKISLLKLYQLFHSMNVEKYLKINVTYDGRNIESSSFGQRCTAAIVILLSLGNNPIVIDEPEAHLDSGLIAKYLVELIKDRKRHRQIIFATHNANFVINGDSELIHVLDMDEQNSTFVTSTTIENKEHRDELYNLEGGKEAFLQRERKYDFPR